MPLAWPISKEDFDRILASYPPALFRPPDDGEGDQPSAIATLWNEADASSQRAALVLLARAGIEKLPPNFDGHELAQTVDWWRSDLRELRRGPEPPTAERNALADVASGAGTFLSILDGLIAHTLDDNSRVASSMFTVHWTSRRLHALRYELAALRDDARSSETKETMRRPNLLPAGKPAGGWSALEAFYGYNLPQFYTSLFGKKFTWTKGKPETGEPPSEGVRFACVIASEVLGKNITPENVVKMARAFRKAAGEIPG